MVAFIHYKYHFFFVASTLSPSSLPTDPQKSSSSPFRPRTFSHKQKHKSPFSLICIDGPSIILEINLNQVGLNPPNSRIRSYFIAYGASVRPFRIHLRLRGTVDPTLPRLHERWRAMHRKSSCLFSFFSLSVSEISLLCLVFFAYVLNGGFVIFILSDIVLSAESFCIISYNTHLCFIVCVCLVVSLD